MGRWTPRSRSPTCRAPDTPTWPARSSSATRRPQRARARQRPRDGRARRRRGRSRGFLAARRRQVHSHVIQIASVTAPERDDLTPRTSRASTTRRPLPRPRRLGGDGRRDRPAAQGERVARRQVRGPRLRPGSRDRLPRLLEREARRPARQAVCSIQSVKGVSLGEAWEVAGGPGSEAHDEIFWSRSGAGTARPTARAAWRAA